MGALNSMPLCSRGRREEEGADNNNNVPTSPDQNAVAAQIVDTQPEATSTPKVVHVEDKDLGESSLDSIGGRLHPERPPRNLETDSGLDQSADELESGEVGIPPNDTQPDSLEEGLDVDVDDFDDDTLDDEIPEINSDDDDDDDVEGENDEQDDGDRVPSASAIKRPQTPLEDIDLSKLEQEVCEPEAGINAEEAESEDETEMEKRLRSKEGSETATAITNMLNQLTAGEEFQNFGRDLVTR